MNDLCTIHQRISSGSPMVRGSEVRLPSGEIIPGIQHVSIDGTPGQMWVVTLTMHVIFGDPIVED